MNRPSGICCIFRRRPIDVLPDAFVAADEAVGDQRGKSKRRKKWQTGDCAHVSLASGAKKLRTIECRCRHHRDSQETIAKLGRLGRSWGCPAVSSGVARTLIDDIKGGQYLFSYYPDESWLRRSQWLNCTG